MLGVERRFGWEVSQLRAFENPIQQSLFPLLPSQQIRITFLKIGKLSPCFRRAMGVPNPQPHLGTKRHKKTAKDSGCYDRTDIHL